MPDGFSSLPHSLSLMNPGNFNYLYGVNIQNMFLKSQHIFMKPPQTQCLKKKDFAPKIYCLFFFFVGTIMVPIFLVSKIQNLIAFPPCP